MPGHGSKLDRRREAAVAALLSHGSLGQAAAACGLSERTLRRWLGEPAFAAEFRARRREIVEHATAVLQQFTGRAVATLGQAMAEAGWPTRMRAAVEVLKMATSSIELFELVQRVTELERRVEGRKVP